jgi:hypothetical protein
MGSKARNKKDKRREELSNKKAMVTCKSVEVQTMGEIQEDQAMLVAVSPYIASKVDVLTTPAVVFEAPQDKQVVSVVESPSIEALSESFTKLDFDFYN